MALSPTDFQKAIVYARVSTDKQVTIPAQLELLEKKCKEFDWDIIKIFTDVESGRTLEREGLKELFDYVLERENKEEKLVLILYDNDRLGRSLLHLQQVIMQLNEYNVVLYTLSSGFVSFDDPSDKLLFDIRGAVSEWEIKQFLRRSKMGTEYRVKQGYTVNRVPRGYKFVDREVIIDEEESWKVLAVFKERHNHGTSYMQIAKRYGLSKSSVIHMLKNQYYLGYIIYNGEVIRGKHRAIIDEEVQHELKIKFNEKKKVIEVIESQ